MCCNLIRSCCCFTVSTPLPRLPPSPLTRLCQRVNNKLVVIEYAPRSLVGAEHVVVLDWDLNSSIMMGPDQQDHFSEKRNCSCGYITFPDSYQIGDMNQHLSADEFSCVADHSPCVNAGRILSGSSLLLACVRGCTDVIQYLLDAGANADTAIAPHWA